MTPDQAYELGYRDGHEAGSKRTGQYVLQEEMIAADDAVTPFEEREDVQASEWAVSQLSDKYYGAYVSGYRLGAEGTPLPE